MANVFDVAKYILQKRGAMTAMKLEKLVYYSQAWSLVWDSKPLFPERIEAWANGPVVPELYKLHRQMFGVDEGVVPMGRPQDLTTDEKGTIDSVLESYGDKSPQWLSELTHVETPWKAARGNLPPYASSNTEITLASMAEYYESLV